MRKMYILKQLMFLFLCLVISLQFELFSIISYLFIAVVISDNTTHQSFKACLFKLLFVRTRLIPINYYRGEQKVTGTKIFTLCMNCEHWLWHFIHTFDSKRFVTTRQCYNGKSACIVSFHQLTLTSWYTYIKDNTNKDTNNMFTYNCYFGVVRHSKMSQWVLQYLRVFIC